MSGRKAEESIGEVFGRLTVLGIVTPGRTSRVLCMCSCGNEKVIVLNSLRAGKVKSCGCFSKEKARERTRERNTVHGMAGTKIYGIWKNMKSRCNNPRFPKYKDYGARGIRVSERWMSFDNFYADMGDPPDGMMLDRKDNDGDYSFDNCRWATASEQQSNKRNNRLIAFEGETKTLTQWANERDMSVQTLSARLNQRGWSIKRALTTSPHDIGPPPGGPHFSLDI